MKIVIIGNSGSGKTWLAEQLASTMSLPIIYLDNLFWQPGEFAQRRSDDDVEFLIRESKLNPSWLVEGVFGELAEQYLDLAELLVWLDIDWLICKSRLEKRASESQMHLGREQSKEGLLRLVEWASHYHERQDLRSFKGHKALVDRFSGKTVRLKFEGDVNLFVESVQQGTAFKFKSAVFGEIG